MDGNPSDLALLLGSAEAEIAAIEGDRRFKAPQGKRGEALHTHVIDLLDAVKLRMGQSPGDDAPEPVRQAFARNLRQSILVLRNAHAALPWLSATLLPTVNIGSLYFTEECARILVGADVDLVVVPDPEFMYSTTSWPFSEFIDQTSQSMHFTPQTKRRPIVLNYPLSDSDRLLLHPIFAHELGHAAVDAHGLVGTVVAALEQDDTYSAALDKIVELMKRDKWTAATVGTIKRTLSAAMRAWMEELLCDHVAVQATGPSFLWSFSHFAIPLTYSDPGMGYPPNTLRVELICQQLKHLGWGPYMKAKAPGVTAWLESVAADARRPMEAEFGFLRDQILEHAQLLRDVAAKRLGANTLRPDAEGQADEAARLLESLILPVGLTDPLPARSILIGGWQAAFRKHGDDARGLVNATRDVQLQELVGKAIEMSTLKTQWATTRIAADGLR